MVGACHPDDACLGVCSKSQCYKALHVLLAMRSKHGKTDNAVSFVAHISLMCSVHCLSDIPCLP